MKSRWKDELTAIPTIYEEELVKLRDREWNDDTHQLVIHIPTFYSCKDQLYNERHKTLPALPTPVADITVDGEWVETTTGQPFLLAEDNINGRMLVFSTQENFESTLKYSEIDDRLQTLKTRLQNDKHTAVQYGDVSSPAMIKTLYSLVCSI
ncbi:unnamed protein product [Mytilus coruscus]|uniref:Uncharacterized protein n=1 Tax=Mytilus coruscus TaxID=42192 RepID=A0A6J8AJD2_MYTCO|nr:unnamed protein product [Mytilus coruscus]